jgi:hypothetical protein
MLKQLLTRQASQSAVRRRWLSMCTISPSHSQWPSEWISFITTMRLHITQPSCTIFLAKHYITQVCQPTLQPRFGSLRLLTFHKPKNAVERNEFVNATVRQYTRSVNRVSLPTDSPHGRVTVNGCALTLSLLTSYIYIYITYRTANLQTCILYI